MITDRVRALLDAVRRRLRLAWAVATLQAFAPMVLVSAVALVLLGRFWERASWAEPAAIGIVVGFVLLVAVAALAVRIDQRLAARAADRGLQTKDAFTSALVLEHAPEPFGTMIRDRADHVAAGATSKDAIPVRLHRRPLVLAAVLGPLALVLGVISNPQDEARRQRAAERAAIAEVADELDARAEELAAQGRAQPKPPSGSRSSPTASPRPIRSRRRPRPSTRLPPNSPRKCRATASPNSRRRRARAEPGTKPTRSGPQRRRVHPTRSGRRCAR
ncbi:MAG: hypothetical protein R2715_08655 [Ilumatobacteraceae bacterium]